MGVCVPAAWAKFPMICRDVAGQSCSSAKSSPEDWLKPLDDIDILSYLTRHGFLLVSVSHLTEPDRPLFLRSCIPDNYSQ